MIVRLLVIGLLVITHSTVFCAQEEFVCDTYESSSSDEENHSSSDNVQSINGNSKCPICLDVLTKSYARTVLPCDENHAYHPSCIEQWLAMGNSCPLCRGELDDDEPTVEAEIRLKYENTKRKLSDFENQLQKERQNVKKLKEKNKSLQRKKRKLTREIVLLKEKNGIAESQRQIDMQFMRRQRRDLSFRNRENKRLKRTIRDLRREVIAKINQEG